MRAEKLAISKKCKVHMRAEKLAISCTNTRFRDSYH